MFDITALGEILIDFTYQGKNEDGQKLFAQNPGGAPANALTAASRLGAKCAFLGKAGEDMHGRFLKDVFCSGSSTSSIAELGSPRWSLPSLSISSKMITGLEDSAFIKLLMIRPGMAPI